MCPWDQQTAVSSTDPAPVLRGMEKNRAESGVWAVVIFSSMVRARKVLLEPGLEGARK